MRGLAIFLLVFSSLPVVFFYPFVGVLLWAWISFMSPHREAYDFASAFPFNFYIAITTFAAWVFSAEAKRLPSQLLPALVIMFAIWTSITTYFALESQSAYLLWDTHIKTMALALVVMGLVNTRLRIQAFLWVTALSIGYFSVKGGGFVLFAGSTGSRIFGPAHSMIADNNNLSLAMVILLPVFNYLRLTSANQYVRWVLVFAIVMTVIAIVGTYSRGGFLGLIIVGIAFFFMSQRKFATAVIAATVVFGIVTFAPNEWKDRMATTQSYEQDSSAKGRLEAWETSWNLANDRLLGGGFGAIEQRSTFFKYRPGGHAEHARAPHSIYFQVMGDHGFVGLALYLAIVAAAVFNFFTIQSRTRGHEELLWANHLSRMLLISTAGFLMAGAFLSMAYYDAFLCMAALSASLREIVSDKLANPDLAGSPSDTTEFVPAWRSASARRMPAVERAVPPN